MSAFDLRIISPERTLFEGEVNEITLSTTDGEITVLAHHEPFVAQLAFGDVIIRKKDSKQSEPIAVYGGFIHIEENGKVTILADSAEHVYEIDEAAAQAAVKKAEEAMAKAKARTPLKSTHEDHQVLAEAQAELLRNMARLRVVRKHRSHRGIKIDK